MRISNRMVYFGAAVVALALAAVPAVAGHGKAGLWNVTTTMNIAGAAMPDMSRLPPDVQAMMRAHGMTMNGNTVSTQHCVTEAEASANGPPPVGNQKDCSVSNLRTSATSVAADMTCRGQMNGTGHLELTYDSAEHYAGKLTMSGTVQGRPAATTTSFDGRWVSADCKGVTH